MTVPDFLAHMGRGVIAQMSDKALLDLRYEINQELLRRRRAIKAEPTFDWPEEPR